MHDRDDGRTAESFQQFSFLSVSDSPVSGERAGNAEKTDQEPFAVFPDSNRVRAEEGDAGIRQCGLRVLIAGGIVIVGVVVGDGDTFDGTFPENLRKSRRADEVVFLFDFGKIPVRQHPFQVGHGQVVRAGQGKQIPEGIGKSLVSDGLDKAEPCGLGFFLAAEGAVAEECDGDRAGILLNQKAEILPGYRILCKRIPGAGGAGGQWAAKEENQDQSGKSFHAGNPFSQYRNGASIAQETGKKHEKFHSTNGKRQILIAKSGGEWYNLDRQKAGGNEYGQETGRIRNNDS